LGELTGINTAIYREAGKALGGLLRDRVEHLGEVVSEMVGEEFGRVWVLAGEDVLGTIGRAEEIIEDVPILGTAFGVYNIYEDIAQHSVIGYIDAGFDAVITGLELVGGEDSEDVGRSISGEVTAVISTAEYYSCMDILVMVIQK